MTADSLEHKLSHFLTPNSTDDGVLTLIKDSVEARIARKDGKLISATLIFPPLSLESEGITGASCCMFFLMEFRGKDIKWKQWLDNAISQFREERVYTENYNGFRLRLTDVDRMFHLEVHPV